MNSYVLITPVRNEENTIEQTIQSVCNQTIQPTEWVIVSDGSIDNTNSIIHKWTRLHSFINPVYLENRPSRNFASVVYVTEQGLKALRCKTYSYIGLLDADVRFSKSYFEILINHFNENPKLGLVGGIVYDIIDCRPVRHHQRMDDVAGATQFFSRPCFESIGQLIPIPEGGWDALTCITARANGYLTKTCPDVVVEHLKPRNAADGHPYRRCWNNGVREYALGNHPVFELLKCIHRTLEHPIAIGGLLRWTSFCYCHLRRRRRVIDAATVNLVRSEQMTRLGFYFSHRKQPEKQLS